MQDNEKKPALRFKGFTDPWEQRKISELAEKTYGGGTPTTSNEAFWNGNIPWIQSSDIVDGKLMGVEPRKYITQTGLNSSATQLVPKDSIAIITRVGVGKLAYMPFSYSTSQDFLSLSKLNTEPFFTVYACYKKLQSELNTVQGTSIKGITKDELLAKTISVPVYSEQKQIGSFFTQLDTLITLHQRKYEKLLNIKKSMLDKMFPQNGVSVPEIRFKGFTDPWEQRKFSELYEKVSRKNDLTYGKDDIISVANMYYKAESYITDENYLLTYNVFEMGDIAFEGNKSKNFAHGRFVENTIGNGIVSHVFDVFKPRMTNYDLQFWKYAINNERIMGPILLRSTKASTMMTNLVADDFLQENFLIPCYEEQKKIGEFLNQLDTLITLHQRKLEKLQNIKKSCLEKMFV